ncbi:MAG: DNRLRE domain-containing protein [Pseudomonadales bacterium]|nr:DNRLRE domain-containing protein [Pseudomonadales bacterium]
MQIFVGVLFFLINTQLVIAAPWNDGPRGASKDYYDSAAKLPWDRKLGDWVDANGENWGNKPYNSTRLNSGPGKSSIQLNATQVVKSWMSGKIKNNGFFLKVTEGSNTIQIFSRESAFIESRPFLILKTDKQEYKLYPSADTYLHPSTYKSLGHRDILEISKGVPTLIWFDLSVLGKQESVESAFLQLSVKKVYGSGNPAIGLFLLNPAPESSIPAEIKMGLAKNYPLDKGISTDPAVYFATGFEGWFWDKYWHDGGKMGSVVDDKPQGKYKPFLGRSLSATIEKGSNTGLNQRFKFVENGFSEPDSAYFRYYLRLADNWNQKITSGKLPGFAGTYNRAGWGGRRPDGGNGWSARGIFLKTITAGNTLRTPVGNYVYHLDQNGNYGSHFIWSRGGGALLKNNQWYCIEQYVKLNEPGKSDGILMAWLDGRLVFERQGLKFRNSKDLKIEEVWLNVYHGGMDPSPYDQTLYIDNIVVAQTYIGPLQRLNHSH